VPNLLTASSPMQKQPPRNLMTSFSTTKISNLTKKGDKLKKYFEQKDLEKNEEEPYFVEDKLSATHQIIDQ